MDHVPAALEHPGERVPVGRSPAVAGVQRAGGVGAYELEQHPATLADVGAGVGVDAGLDHVGQHLVEPRVGEAEVDEARPGDLHRRDVGGRRGVEDLGQPAGELPRVPAGALGRGQGHVRRPVAVLAPRRALEDDGLGHGRDLERGEGRVQRGGELVADHGRRVSRWDTSG